MRFSQGEKLGNKVIPLFPNFFSQVGITTEWPLFIVQ